MKTVRCLACESSNIGLLGSAKFENIENVNDKKFIQEKYKIYECDECGLVFKNPIMNSAILEEYYNSIDFSVWFNDGKLNEPEKKVKNFLASEYQGQNVSILDFGCSIGRFLSALPETFVKHGVEIDLRAAVLAKTKGILIVDVDNLGVYEKYDVIVMFNVFEHLEKPMELLKKLSSCLNPYGQLIISTGTTDSIPFKIQGHRHWYIDFLQHFIMLNSKFTKYLANELGMEIVSEISSVYVRVSPIRSFYTILKFILYIILEKVFSLFTYLFRIETKLRYFRRNKYPSIEGFKDHSIIILKK